MTIIKPNQFLKPRIVLNANFILQILLNLINNSTFNIQRYPKPSRKKYPHLLALYQSKFDQKYWEQIEKRLRELSSRFRMPLKGFCRH